MSEPVSQVFRFAQPAMQAMDLTARTTHPDALHMRLDGGGVAVTWLVTFQLKPAGRRTSALIHELLRHKAVADGRRARCMCSESRTTNQLNRPVGVETAQPRNRDK